MFHLNHKCATAILLGVSLTFSSVAQAQTTSSVSKASRHQTQTYSPEEIMAQGHQFFGKASRGMGQAIEYAFQSQGEPSAYIVGEEGAGAGPSIGWDFGGNGSRTLTLVYGSQSPRDLYARFAGVEGSAYLVGGIGVNFQRRDDIILAPIRTGMGARLGANIGYLKYSKRPTWNPF